MQHVTSGLEDWLKHQGLGIEQQLIMDPQNAAFPIPVTRNVGGFRLQDWRMLDYPYFLDVRGAGLNGDHITTAELPQVTMAWSSPITLAADTGTERTVTPLLRSSPDAWLSDSTDVMPAVDASGNSSYAPSDERASQVVGVISAGQFTSYFAGKDSPLLAAAPEAAATTPEGETPPASPPATTVSSVIEKSPESARIILFSSNDFLNDQILGFLGTATNSDYQNSLQLMANTLDFALEDEGLLSIRSRSHFNRTLPPLAQNQQMFWEYFNYALAALALGLIALWHKRRNHSRQLQFARYISE
jgi:ABC-2 type transport system permease protein